jgi:branched-chain amino acid transport system substrate-binding protein
MRVRYAIAVVLTLTVAQPLTGRLAKGDTQLDNALQTALDIGQVVGAALACPDIAQGRVRTLTERFKAALKQFGDANNENAAIANAFDQGIVFGGQSIGARQLRCDGASRNLADWEANKTQLMPSRTGVPAAPVAPTPTPPPVAEAPAAPSLFAPPAAPVVAPPVVAPPSPVAAAPTAPNLPNVQGVTDKEIRFGMAAPFSGPAQELGRQMRLGIDAAFSVVNDAGGINGRKLVLIAADDGYEPSRTGEAMKQLYEKDLVFGFIGNVGTPTTVVALPYAMTHRALFFGAFTGAPLLRSDPPDRYVFNYRASYAEETFAVVHYLVKIRRLKPEQIAVFAQQDGYGDAGFEGVAAAMRALSPTGDVGVVPRFGYQRNTDEVDGAIGQLLQYQRLHTTAPIKAVVMVATAKAAARFIGFTRDRVTGLIYTNVSFVGSTALARELLALGPKIADGTIVTQVVPPIDSYSSVVLNYKAALTKYAPNAAPDYVSFEGYLDANVLIEGLRRVGPQIDTERLVNALETIRDFDLGVGPKITFGSGAHQALHKIWGSQLDDKGNYKAINLE